MSSEEKKNKVQKYQVSTEISLIEGKKKKVEEKNDAQSICW